MFKRMTDSIRMFITDVRAELKKVSFPSRSRNDRIHDGRHRLLRPHVVVSLGDRLVPGVAGGQDHLMNVRKTVSQSSL